MESRLLMPERRFWAAIFAALFFACYVGNAASAAEAPAGVRLAASLRDHVQAYRRPNGEEYMRWRSDWVVTWAPLAHVRHYEIRYKTSEGVSRKTGIQVEPQLVLEVAKGDNPKAAGWVARATQLATIEGLLAVSVVVHFEDGSRSLPTPWLAVGSVITAQQ